MKALSVFLTLIILALAAAVYYLYDINQKMRGELDTLRADAEASNQIRHTLEAKIDDLSKENDQEIERLKGTYNELVAGMKDEIEKGQIKITQLEDGLSVSMVDKILFPSGEAEIKPDGIGVLERVGKVLKETERRIVRVEGHTDNVRIGPKLSKKFPTNWELSTARATNVVRFLEEHVGIEPGRLQAVGMSQYHPVASNDTLDGQSQNRRIEIALLPEIMAKKDSDGE